MISLWTPGGENTLADIECAASLLLLETGEGQMLEAVRCLVRERDQARNNYIELSKRLEAARKEKGDV